MALPPRNGPRQRTRVEKRSVSDPGSQMNPANAGVGAAAIGAVFTKFGAQFKAEEDAAEELRIAAQDADYLAQATALARSDPDGARRYSMLGTGDEFNRVWNAISVPRQRGFPSVIARGMAAARVDEVNAEIAAGGDPTVTGREMVTRRGEADTLGMPAAAKAVYIAILNKGTSSAVSERAGERLKAVKARAVRAQSFAVKQYLETPGASSEGLKQLTAQGLSIPGLSTFDAAREAQEITDQVLGTALAHVNPNIRLKAEAMAMVTDSNGYALRDRLSPAVMNKLREEGENATRANLGHAFDLIKEENKVLIEQIKIGELTMSEADAKLAAMDRKADRFNFRQSAEYLGLRRQLMFAKSPIVKGQAVYRSFNGGLPVDNPTPEAVNDAQALASKKGDQHTMVRMVMEYGPGKDLIRRTDQALTNGSFKDVERAMALVSIVTKANQDKATTINLPDMLPNSQALDIYQELLRVPPTERERDLKEIRSILTDAPPGPEALVAVLSNPAMDLERPTFNAWSENSDNIAPVLLAVDPDRSNWFDKDTDNINKHEFTPAAAQLMRKALERAARMQYRKSVDPERLRDAVAGSIKGKLIVAPSGYNSKVMVTLHTGPKFVGVDGKRVPIPPPTYNQVTKWIKMYGESASLGNMRPDGSQPVHWDDNVVEWGTANGGAVAKEMLPFLNLAGFRYDKKSTEDHVFVHSDPPQMDDPWKGALKRPVFGHPSAFFQFTEEENGQGAWRLMTRLDKIDDEQDLDTLVQSLLKWVGGSSNKPGVDPNSVAPLIDLVAKRYPLAILSKEELTDKATALKNGMFGSDGFLGGQVGGPVQNAELEAIKAEQLRRSNGGLQLTVESLTSNEGLLVAFEAAEKAAAEAEGGSALERKRQSAAASKVVSLVRDTLKVEERTIDWGADDSDNQDLVRANRQMLMDRVEDGTYPRAVLDLPRLADQEATIAAADTESSRLNTRITPEVMSNVAAAVMQQQVFSPVHVPLTPTPGGTSEQAINNNPGDLKLPDGTRAKYDTLEDGIRAMDAALESSFMGVNTNKSDSYLRSGMPAGIPLSGDIGQLVTGMGFELGDWEVYRREMAYIESRGIYTIPGGANKHYDGRYQLGRKAKKDAAAQLGETAPAHNPTDRRAYRNNPEMQERYFAAFTKANHNYLMKKNPEYAEASPRRKLQILGYAHNQGMGGADTWLTKGIVGADANKIKGTKYSEAIADAFDKGEWSSTHSQRTLREVLNRYLAQTNDSTRTRGFFERVATKVGVKLDQPIHTWVTEDREVARKEIMNLTQGQRDSGITESRVPGARANLKDEPAPMTGSLRNTIGYGTDLDWPSTKDEMAALEFDRNSPLNEEQAERLLQTRLSTIRTMMDNKFDGAEIAPNQFNALMQAIYTSPWIKTPPGAQGTEEDKIGHPEVLTDKMVDAVYAGDWRTVEFIIRRSNRVTTQGLSQQQKLMLKEYINNQRKAQIALLRGGS